jgi:hypothetical protein
MAQDSTVSLAKPFGEANRGDKEKTINDMQFIRDLNRLKELRSFFIQEAVRVDDQGALSFGELNLLRYSQTGRPPTQDEWSDVEYHTQTLFGLLTEPLRQRFVRGDIPAWIAALPFALMILALTALIAAIRATVQIITVPQWELHDLGLHTLPFYLVWLISLGALGAVAFIGMNALSVQHDITFDVSNRRLMLLRITLGALFGLVLTLPFGFAGFMQFLTISLGQKLPPEFATPTTVWSQATLLLLPFVLGFSTSLVITIMNRLVESVQAFFGKTGTSEPTKETESKTPAKPVLMKLP